MESETDCFKLRTIKSSTFTVMNDFKRQKMENGLTSARSHRMHLAYPWDDYQHDRTVKGFLTRTMMSLAESRRVYFRGAYYSVYDVNTSCNSPYAWVLRFSVRTPGPYFWPVRPRCSFEEKLQNIRYSGHPAKSTHLKKIYSGHCRVVRSAGDIVTNPSPITETFTWENAWQYNYLVDGSHYPFHFVFFFTKQSITRDLGPCR
jgi:hypothetical protein